MWFIKKRQSSPLPTVLPPLPSEPVIVPARVVQLSASRVAEMIMLTSLKISATQGLEDPGDPISPPSELPVAAIAPSTESPSIAAWPEDEIAEMIASSMGVTPAILGGDIPPALLRALAARTSHQRDQSHAELMSLLEAEVVDETRSTTQTPFEDSMAALRAIDSRHWNKGTFLGRARTARVWTRCYGPKIGAILLMGILISGVVSDLWKSMSECQS